MDNYNYLVIVHKEDGKELAYFYSLATAEDYCMHVIDTDGANCELFRISKIRDYMA